MSMIQPIKPISRYVCTPCFKGLHHIHESNDDKNIQLLPKCPINVHKLISRGKKCQSQWHGKWDADMHPMLTNQV